MAYLHHIITLALGCLHVSHVLADFVPIDRSQWTVAADSFQPGNEPQNVLDGNIYTIWHTAYDPVNAPLPHTLTIDMAQSYVVNGVQILPRQDGNSNGNIGQHQIELSVDNATWSDAVVVGSYLNNALLKKSVFTPAVARFIRIIALSEAQNQGHPWTSIAEINVTSPDPTSPASSFAPPPTNLGRWGPTIDFPLVPVAGSLLDTGDLLVWSAYRPDGFSVGAGFTQTALLSLSSLTVTPRVVTNTQHDMFCPGISIDGHQNLIVTGGSDAARTSIYNPSSDSWSPGPSMNLGRGYQSTATLSDGRVFVIGGSWNGGVGGKNGEVFDGTTWTLLPGCPVAPMLTNDAQGLYRADNHAWLFGWQNNSVFQAGPSRAMNWYDASGAGGQSPAGLRAQDSDSMCGNAVMLDAVSGRILTLGGSPSYQDSSATAAAHIITIASPGSQPTVQQIGSMAFARAFHNSVLLPDGNVLIVGGQSYAVPFSDDNAALYPELFNTQTNQFTTLAPIIVPRVYHSIALLLPDATLLSAGGGLCADCATNHFDGQILTPPYLFAADGSLAARPQILSVSPLTVSAGGSLTVTTDTPAIRFTMIRSGTATHTVDTDQRFVELQATSNGLTYTMQLPGDSGMILPGPWLLFALNSAGVPSVSQRFVVQI